MKKYLILSGLFYTLVIIFEDSILSWAAGYAPDKKLSNFQFWKMQLFILPIPLIWFLSHAVPLLKTLTKDKLFALEIFFYTALILLHSTTLIFQGSIADRLVTFSRGENSPGEVLTAVFFLLASIILWVTSINRGAEARVVKLALKAISLFTLLLFFEETSYLQHLLRYETPTLIAAYNLQGEANLHNLEAFRYGPYIFGISMSVYVGITECLSRNWLHMPHYKVLIMVPMTGFGNGRSFYFFFFIWFSAAGTALGGEYQEQSLAVFFLFYSIRFWYSLARLSGPHS